MCHLRNHHDCWNFNVSIIILDTLQNAYGGSYSGQKLEYCFSDSNIDTVDYDFIVLHLFSPKVLINKSKLDPFGSE